MEQSLPHGLCSELLLIAALLSTFEAERRLGRLVPSLQILAAVFSLRLTANIAIRARRRRIRGAIDDVGFVFRHEI